MTSQLKHKLHPRTGFMIFFPGFILLACLIWIATSQRLQEGGAFRGFVAILAIDGAVVCSLLWSDFGHTLSWDNEAVYLRAYGGRFLMRRHPFEKVRFDDFRGLIFHPAPRGVPPKFPLLQLDAPSNPDGAPLLIDPNFFTGASLASFINELCGRRPEMRQGKQGKAIDRLLKTLGA